MLLFGSVLFGAPASGQNLHPSCRLGMHQPELPVLPVCPGLVRAKDGSLGPDTRRFVRVWQVARKLDRLTTGPAFNESCHL